MPARAKRYTFADTSFRQARTTQQPVHAWKKVWTTPTHFSEEGAHTTPYKLFKWTKTGQTVVHEDEDEEIASSLASQLPPDVATDPVPISEQGEVPSPVLALATEDNNADQGITPQPTDNGGATQGNDSAGSAEKAVEAAVAAVEDVAAATYSAYAIGNINASGGFDYPVPDREEMSVDGDNSAPTTPSAAAAAATAVDPTYATTSLPESLAQPAAESGSAANHTHDNEATNSSEQAQS